MVLPNEKENEVRKTLRKADKKREGLLSVFHVKAHENKTLKKVPKWNLLLKTVAVIYFHFNERDSF